ncbi:MAG: pseudouridine synthase [Spirochaetota bacterium]
MSHNNGIRLQVYLARCGIGSRRKNEEYIAAGMVSVNGRTVTEPGTKVYPGDEVYLDGRAVRPEAESRYIALYKPPRYICSNYDPEGRSLAVDLLSPHFAERLHNVGRLDFMSEGLIFFTNDGSFTRVVSHPSSEIEKEYRIFCHHPVHENTLRQWKRGIEIGGTFYKIKSFRIISPEEVLLTLIEGKNREIRNLFKASGIDIKRLIRVRIGPVTLENLSPGSFRLLSKDEVNWFFKRGD